LPSGEQLSAIEVSHATHAAPPVPQALLEGLVQVLPTQQPVGHDVVSQTHFPDEHRCPTVHSAPPPQLQTPFTHESASVGSQAMHVAPPVPQLASVGAWQVPPMQQPVGHARASQTQVPPTQL
jgi:hypothetical protein